MYYSLLDFPLGQIFLAKTEKGLSAAWFLRDKDRFKRIFKYFERKDLLPQPNDQKFQQERKLFDRYFAGKKEDFTSLSLDFISGTTYQRKVWLETRKIPFGETRPYKYLAHKLHHNGYRSIGQALSKNPLLVVIPCHRVISSDGRLGGFTGGLDLKKFLLRLEQVNIPA